MTSYASSSHTPPRKRHEVVTFTPTTEQVEVATRRILGVFQKFGGAIRVGSQAELVRVLGREVHNRNRRLGDYRNGDFTVTLRVAVRAAIKAGDIVRTDGWYGSVATGRKKTHHQKYPARGRKRVAA